MTKAKNLNLEVMPKMPYNEANPNLSTCDNCDEVIPLIDLQGHGLGVCAKCRGKPSVIASYEHPREAGDAVIAESILGELEEEKQRKKERSQNEDGEWV